MHMDIKAEQSQQTAWPQHSDGRSPYQYSPCSGALGQKASGETESPTLIPECLRDAKESQDGSSSLTSQWNT